MDEIKERFEGKSERWRKRYLLLMTKLYKDVKANPETKAERYLTKEENICLKEKTL